MNAAENSLMKQAVIFVDNDNIAIKPTCDLLGIDYKTQVKIIKSDFVLNQLGGISSLVGADKKKRNMISLPKSGFLRWVNGINIKKVSENAQQNLITMQLLIANYLYNGEQKANAYSNYISQLKTFVERDQDIRNTIASLNRELAKNKKEQQLLLASDPRQLALEFTQATKQLNS